jgi:choline-sulfatase
MQSEKETDVITERPIILILMTDQHRAESLSCAAHPIVQTPNIDRLAAEGLRFSRAYAASPVSMPARSSFLTGLYCHNHGQWGNMDRASFVGGL